MDRSEQQRPSIPAEQTILNTPSSLKLPSKARTGSRSGPSQSKPAFARAKSYSRKESPEKLPKLGAKSEENKCKRSSLIEEISEFNSNAINSLNQGYIDSEEHLASSLDALETQFERIQAMRDSAADLTRDFETQTQDTELALDSELAELRNWQAPNDKLEKMQERVYELKQILNTSKEKLARLDEELTRVEEKDRHCGSKVRRSVAGIQCVVTLLAVALAYYFYKRLTPKNLD